MISDASDLLNTETSDTESRDAIKNGLKTLTHVLNQEIKNIQTTKLQDLSDIEIIVRSLEQNVSSQEVKFNTVV